MVLSSSVSRPISQLQLAPGSVVTIPEVSWQEFEAILLELGEKRSARIAYSEKTLEIMVPLPEHEIPTDLMSDIAKLLLRLTGQRYQPFGSTTFKREGVAGVEPDACFYIRHYERMIGRRRLQAGDPPPDLAIETDVTSKTVIGAYRALAVPEVWIYDEGVFTIFVFQDGDYVESTTSATFPDLPISALVVGAISRAWQVGSLQALEELEATVRGFEPED